MANRKTYVTQEKRAGAAQLSASTYNVALTMPVPMPAPPSQGEDGVGLLDTAELNRAQFFFAGTNAENETFAYQVIGLLELGGERKVYMPERIGVGVITLGAKTLGAAGDFLESATAFIADTITKTDDNGRSWINSPGSDEIANLMIDVSRYQFVYVQVTRNGQTAATMTILGSSYLDSTSHVVNDVEVAGIGLATAALQTALNALLAVGTGVMASAQAVTLATDDTQLGAVGAAADVDGNLHGQQRYIGETIAAAAADLNELTAAPVEKARIKIECFPAVPGTAERFTLYNGGAAISSGTLIRSLELQAKKLAADNVGNVHGGLIDTLDAGVLEMFEAKKGTVWSPDIPLGTSLDLYDLGVDNENAGDGFVGWYTPV